jgi:hypothetical protein
MLPQYPLKQGGIVVFEEVGVVHPTYISVMIDDLSMISVVMWEELLAVIPPHLKFKETDRKVYEFCHDVGMTHQGTRNRASGHIALKNASSIYIDWFDTYVSVMFTQRSMLEGRIAMEPIKGAQIFFYKDPPWLKHMLKFIMEVIVVFDARFHIMNGKPYKLWPTETICEQMMTRLTQEA